MPIEFRCSECNRLLRTGDDTAGRQAKCPECGTIMTIPSPAQPTPPQGVPPSPDVPSSPFGAGGAGPSSPYGAPGGMGGPPPGDPTNPYRSPTGDMDEPVGYSTKGPIVPTVIDLGDILSHTWEILKERFLLCLGVVIAVGLIGQGVSQGLGIMAGIAGAAAGDKEIVLMLNGMSTLVSIVFNMWLGIGQTMFLLKVARGEEASFGLIFAGGRYFLPILGLSILIFLIVFCGLLLLIVPGIILSLMFSQAYCLVIDRKMGIMESLEVSRQIMVGNKLTLFAVYLLAGLGGAAIIVLTCCIGIFLVGPYLALLSVVVYLVATGQATARQAYGIPPQPAAGLE